MLLARLESGLAALDPAACLARILLPACGWSGTCLGFRGFRGFRGFIGSRRFRVEGQADKTFSASLHYGLSD